MPRHLIIAGAQRSGTTWLARALSSHPRVLMAEPARPEPKWFLDPSCELQGIEAYHRRWFAGARPGMVLLDKSTSYLESPEAAARIARLVPDASVIVALRHPIARAVSHARFSIENGVEGRTLEAALSGIGPTPHWDRDAISVSPFKYRERGRYIEVLEPFLRACRPGALQVLITEEITNDPGAVRALLAGLDLDPRQVDEASLINPINASIGEAMPLDDALEAELTEYFAPSIAALERFLGREIPSWH